MRSPAAVLLGSLLAVHTQASDLKVHFEEVIRGVSDWAAGFGIELGAQIGWHSNTEHFTAAGGRVRNPGLALGRNMSETDTFLFGSGTKPVTAGAVMRLIEQRKISAHAPVHTYLDPYLLSNNGTTLAGIFGSQIATATAMDLIRMTAGVPDFEVGSFDNEVLQAGTFVPVYENIHYAANMQDTGGYCETVDDCNCATDAPGWCANNRCYSGHADTRCVNASNGSRLNDYEWCWNGIENHQCQSKYSSPMLCNPGNCSAYSSTGYELAGLLIAAIETASGDYTDMDLGAYAFSDRSRYPSMFFPPVTDSKGGTHNVTASKLSDHLTGPGTATTFGKGLVFDQNPGILGWTCGHMVAQAGDVATYFYDLLAPESSHRILNNASVKEMTRAEPLTVGWSTGLYYGAGIMLQSTSQNRSYHPHSPDQWGYSVGHGGMTYGFSSLQGYIKPAGAGFSVATNVDNSYFSNLIVCAVMEVAAAVIAKEDAMLNCSFVPKGVRDHIAKRQTVDAQQSIFV